MSIHDRKVDHLDLTIKGMASYEYSAGLDRFRLKHNALPELNLSDVSTEVCLFGRTFAFPLFVSSMTGGTNKLGQINAQLAEVASELNIPIGLGSQRVMLEDKSSIQSFKIAREVAPKAFIGANIGGQQLLGVDSKTIIKKIIEPVKADALIIHLNVLQEMMQPEGDNQFKGILGAISDVIKSVTIPVIVKETGAGLSGQVVKRLYDIGTRAVDVAGSGGTSWAKVENLRSQNQSPKTIFNNWGIPTAQCLIEISDLQVKDLDVISSGGIRTSLDVLKSIALGAKMGAMAQPIIKVLHEQGQDGLKTCLESIQNELRIGMLLLGVERVSKINQQHIYIQ
jgi:isopentenyl-diphosphate delta-isomerase